MEELTACEGTVHSVIFQNAENGYTVLRLLTEEGEVVTVVGCIPCVAPGEHLTVSGVWETHPQHGEQLRAVELERMLPEDEEEIFDYLSSGICRGVGPATARRIVDRFGVETLDILEREPERLNLIKGITAKKAQEIAESFRQHMGLRRLMAFLARYELPPVLAMQLRQQYGDAALEMVEKNPYLLSGDSCGVDFSVTDRIALGMGIDPDSDERIQAAVTFELSHNENNGHVFLPRPKLVAATAQLLQCTEEPVERALAAGRSAILEIDVQGSAQVKLRRSDTIRIFVLPPSWQALKSRLISRARDPLKDVAVRLKNAYHELEEGLKFDYAIENGEREAAARDLLRVIRAEDPEEFALARQRGKIEALLNGYEEVETIC